MPLGMEVIQLPLKGGTAAPHVSAHVYCGQMAGWIKMPLDTEVGLGSGSIVLDGDPTERGTTVRHLRPMSVVAKRLPMSATAELLFKLC